MNENIFHQDLARGRWQQFSLLEQMANIGSEVGRAITAREQGKEERAIAASYRALELFDLSLDDPKLRHRLKEIARARECFADFFFGENEYNFTAEWWQKYFLDFAIAARQSR
ncbi:MAG: hypothetical protein WCG84_00535, partial [Candidatus Moraniibacteriota bacterium]